MRRRISVVLVFAGSAALVWYLSVLASAAFFNWYESWRLDLSRPGQNRARELDARAPRLATPYSPSRAPELHAVIGRLEIPRLHLSAVVLEGDDDSALRYGLGHVPGTSLPEQIGNVSIAGHRDTFFRALRHVEPDDRITLTTPDGAYIYNVLSTEIVNPDAVWVLNASAKPILTLITCYPFYYVGPAPRRFIVHARRSSDRNHATMGTLIEPGGIAR